MTCDFGTQVAFPSPQPLRAFAQRRRCNPQRVVVVPRLFFPDVERRIAPVLRREVEVVPEQSCGSVPQSHLVLAHPLQHRECAQRRAIVLGPRPSRDVDRAVGVHAACRRTPRSPHVAGQLFIRAHVLLEVGHDLLAPGRRRDERAAVELFERQAEAHEVGEVAEAPSSADVARFVEQPHGIDHDGRIAEPMEEVVRIRVVGAEHRRGDDGAPRGPHGLPEAGALLHDRPTAETLGIIATAACRYSRSSHCSSRACALVHLGRRALEVRAAEAEAAQAGLHFRHAHEQFPQKARAMVLHHHDDRALVDGEICLCVPVPRRSQNASMKP